MNLLQPVRGMNDILPDALAAWRHVEHAVVATFEEYGYREIRFPLVEHTELFARSIGTATDIVEKEMYTFLDRNGDSLTLRPEGTAVCVRAALANGLLHNQTPRLWYHGAMFRHERPQKGRYRQFHQFGAEAFGMPGPDIDAEVILLAARLWRRLGLDGVRLELNSLGDAADRARHRAALVDYLERNRAALDEDSLRRLGTNPLRILDSKNPALRTVLANAPALPAFLGDDARAHFERLQETLAACGVAFAVNPRLVRGLDYYNRTVFEFVTDRLGSQDAVCSGGRYDGLVEQLGGDAVPAVGWAMGVERLVALVEQAGKVPAAPEADVYAVLVGEKAERAGPPLVERLRDALPGCRIQVNTGGGGFKAQLRRADRSGARFALIVGDDEAARGAAALKSLRGDGAQATVPFDELAGRIAAALGTHH